MSEWKALSLRQPYLWMVLRAGKTIENLWSTVNERQMDSGEKVLNVDLRFTAPPETSGSSGSSDDEDEAPARGKAAKARGGGGKGARTASAVRAGARSMARARAASGAWSLLAHPKHAVEERVTRMDGPLLRFGFACARVSLCERPAPRVINRVDKQNSTHVAHSYWPRPMRAIELDCADDASGDGRCGSDDCCEDGVAGDASMAGIRPREPDCCIDEPAGEAAAECGSAPALLRRRESSACCDCSVALRDARSSSSCRSEARTSASSVLSLSDPPGCADRNEPAEEAAAAVPAPAPPPLRCQRASPAGRSACMTAAAAACAACAAGGDAPFGSGKEEYEEAGPAAASERDAPRCTASNARHAAASCAADCATSRRSASACAARASASRMRVSASARASSRARHSAAASARSSAAAAASSAAAAAAAAASCFSRAASSEARCASEETADSCAA